MNATDHRKGIVSILVVNGHITARELSQEFFVMDGYKPYNNTLTPCQL